MPKQVAKSSSPLKISPKKIIDLISRIKTTYILVFLLIVAAFLIGVLYTKVSLLEKGTLVTGQAGTNAGVSPAPAGYTLGNKADIAKNQLPALGDAKKAKVQIVEYADFQCPFCEKWFTEIEQSLIKDYVDKGLATFSFHHFAFLGQESTDSANASECANEQGKFWDYHDYLYSHQGQENSGAFSVENLKQFAANLGLDTVKFNSCLDSNKYSKNVQDDIAAGQKAGVNGTPATFINGKMVLFGGNSAGALPYTELKKFIDQELK